MQHRCLQHGSAGSRHQCGLCPWNLDSAFRNHTRQPDGSLRKGSHTEGLSRESRSQVVALLHETWAEMTPKTSYEVLAGFKEAPFRGRFVNVDRSGFRRSEPQEGWPPDPAKLNIFVFGGSTVFGYGVSDRETLASALQAELRSHREASGRHNFGRASYFSTQELMLYYWLLTSGHVPALAIFVDGLNDFSRLNGQLDNTAYLSSLIEDENSGYGATLLRLFRRTATGRAIAWLERKLGDRRTLADRRGMTLPY